MFGRKVSWALSTLAVCAGLWCCLSPQTTDAAGGGKAVEVSLVDADGKPLSSHSVEFLRLGGKPYEAYAVNKNTWVVKDADDKMTVKVQSGRLAGTVDLSLPADSADLVSFIVTVDGANVRAKMVSGGTGNPPGGSGKIDLNSPEVQGSTRSTFIETNRPSAIQKGPKAATNTTVKDNAQYAVPPNDNCVDAIPVGALPASVIGSTVDATDDAGSPSCGFSTGPFKNIWYTVVGTGEPITISTCNAGTTVDDTKISVFCGDCAARACVGGDDDGCPATPPGTFKSVFTFCSEAGRTYLITVGGFSATTVTGTIQLDVTSSGAACAACDGVCEVPAVPSNDTCTGALAMGPLPDSATVNNALATNDTLPACGTAPHNKTTWYSVIGDGTTYTVTTCNDCTSVSDTEVVVYCGSCAAPTCIGGDDDGCPATPPGTLKSVFTWCTQPGATYLIAVGNFSSSAVGRIQVDVTSNGVPGCAGAVSCLAAPTGACCDAGGVCTGTTEEANCTGTWHAGESCPAFACPGPGGCPDTCGTAAAVSSLPFNATGDTCTCSNDYDSVCPYTGSTSSDAVYSFTPSQDMCVDISLCNGSDYDTKVYVFANNCSTAAIACNDDTCTSPNFPDPYVSELNQVSLTGGTTYYIVVDGYNGACGNYVLDVTQVNCPAPCGVCPPGATAENEPDCASVNGGCNSAPPVFSPIACGQTYCGTSLWDGSTRDTDWYEVTFAADTEFTWTVQAEFAAVIGMVETSPLGNPDCATATALDPFAVSTTCGEVSVTRCVPPGTYWFFVAPDFNGPTFTCGADYTARLDCIGCTPPTCVGDTCEAAQVIPSTPYSTTGDSCLCNDNYDEICPFDTPGSADVVYKYTPVADECVDISMCGNSAYDSKLYVYQGSCGTYQSGTAIACNDDECTTPSFGAPYVSEVTGVNLIGGQDYYIVVDGYAGDCGAYTLDIGPCAPPCDVACAPGSTPEFELNCGLPEDTVNGGCNSATPVFSPLACNQTYCGTAAFDGATRDTDWYQVTVGSSTRFTWTANSEFASLTGPVPTSPAGTGNCADVLGVIDPALFGEECVPGSVVTECLPAGTYWFFMAPTFDDTVECGKQYEVGLSCEPCVIPLGACCRPDGSCDDGIAEAACENWQGDGTLCANVNCPQPPDNDLCDDAITVAIPSTTPGDTSLATFDTGLPATCGTSIDSPGVWYEVTGNGNTLTADTCNGATPYDSKISVFCPNCATPACVGGNDDFCGLQTSVSWCSAPGETYLILVHGFGGQTGPFELVISNGPACSNPPSCEATPVCGNPGAGDCCTATPGLPGCSDAACCDQVCACDSYCCQVEWDLNCAGPNGFVPGCSALELGCCGGGGQTGGCCRGLACTIETQADCEATGGGTYLGDGTSCGSDGGNPTVFESDVGSPIEDGTGVPTLHSINVPAGITVEDLNIDVAITHTWVGDLVITVEHNGTTVVIVDQMGVPASGFGCPEDNLNIVLNDEGNGGLIEDQCTPGLSSPPDYTPNNPLSAFDGMSATGMWTIGVSDNAGFDTGTLDHWSLHFGQPGPSVCIPSGACCTSPVDCAVTTEADCTGVYLGDGTNCSASGPVSVYEADPEMAIPDAPAAGGAGTPIQHVINVPDSFTLADVDIDLVTTHTWVGDLIVSVEHGGTTVVVVDRAGYAGTGFGCGSDNYDVILDDSGSGGAIEDLCGVTTTPPSPPNYTPNNPLSVFNGMNSSGNWTITVTDNANLDIGTLNHWSLHLTAPGDGPCSGVSFCGNGIEEAGEECDDGNASNTDACVAGCLDAECGDGYVYAGVEECDDGNASNTDSCTNACENPVCGDGFVQAGEQCDDGNGINTDACTNACRNAVCGDGIVRGGFEQCDDGNLVNDDDCTNACTSPICGDGIVQASNNEECDGLSADACDGVCLEDCTCEPSAIPTMSEWGLAVMALLLLIGAKLYFGRREVVA